MKRPGKLSQRRIFSSKALARVAVFSSIERNPSIVLIFCALSLMLFSVLRPDWAGVARAAVVDVLSPVFSAVITPLRSAALVVRNVSGLAALQVENARLEEENARLRDWHQTALLLEAENKSLRALLNVKIEPQNQYISAQILSDPGKTFIKSVLVSAGYDDGVEKGQAVISSQGVVGRVIEVGRSSSRVLLITDINSRLPIILEDSRLHAIMSGENKDLGRLVHLPPESSVNEGARVVTSGHGGLFSLGLPVGIVETDKSGASFVRPFVDFNRLVHVRIVDKQDDPNLREGILN